MKIAHLSDLHVGEGPIPPRIEAIRRLFRAIIHDPDIDAVCITGDLTDHGRQEEYDAIEPLLHWLAKYKHLIMNLGNHDAGFMGIWYQQSSYDRGIKMIERITSVPHDVYPVVQIIEKVRFIELDTMKALSLRRWSLAKGKVGSSQMEALRGLLDTQTPTVVCLHHHPYTRRHGLQLVDGNDLIVTLAGTNAIVLYGHMHVAEVRGRYYASDKSVDSMGYRVIDTDTGKWEWVNGSG